MSGWLRNIRDAADILGRARSGTEALKAVVPKAWLSHRVLNDAGAPNVPQSATEVATRLRKLRNELKVAAISESGDVDYKKLAGSPLYRELEEVSRLLAGVDPTSLTTDDERLAFWINLYNVLAIHGVIALGIAESVMEVPSFFSVVAYRVGDTVLTLDDMENGVLRRNAPHPATKRPLFKDGDPRLAYCPSVVDPRIHAALVCASASCPPVAFYDADRIADQLDAASDNYVAADVVVDETAQTVRIPITFRYYSQDFGGTEGIQSFILEHARDAHRAALDAAFGAGFPFDYHRYDWSLNAIA